MSAVLCRFSAVNIARAAIHRETLAAALGRALVHFLGVHPCGRGHVPAVIRLDPFRDGRHRAGTAIRRSSSACTCSRSISPARSRRWSSTCSTFRLCSSSWACRSRLWRRRSRSRRLGSPAVRRRSAPARDAVRRIDHRHLLDSVDASDARDFTSSSCRNSTPLPSSLRCCICRSGSSSTSFSGPPSSGVAFYREAGAKGDRARCARCGTPFASRMHIDDLKKIEHELGIAYEFSSSQALVAHARRAEHARPLPGRLSAVSAQESCADARTPSGTEAPDGAAANIASGARRTSSVRIHSASLRADGKPKR